MTAINYTYDKNIKRDGSTVGGEAMYSIVDSKGEKIYPQRTSGLDYELATFFVDWINEGNTKPAGMTEVLRIVQEREA